MKEPRVITRVTMGTQNSMYLEFEDAEHFADWMAERPRVHYKNSFKNSFLPEPMVKAIDALVAEREFQDRKYSPIGQGGEHQLGEWLLLIEAELSEAKHAIIKGGTGRNSLRSELVQVGALVLAALEQHGTVDPHEGRQI